jgi:hypothetical protein
VDGCRKRIEQKASHAEWHAQKDNQEDDPNRALDQQSADPWAHAADNWVMLA